jgi:hypothetical protein
MPPRQLSNKLLNNCLVNVSFGKRPHREEIGSRKAMNLQELRPQILGLSLDHLRSLPFITLAAQYLSANAQIE